MSRPRKNWLEWSVFAVSAALLLIIAGWLAVAAVRDSESPPDLQITTGAPQGHRVHVVVRNRGASTAEAVRIEVVLLRGAEEVERAELDFAFVPHGSKREGFVEFRRDPRCCAIVSRASAYEVP